MSIKLGCQNLTSSGERVISWWWKPLWEVKAPTKNKIFMWMEMKNRVLTWEKL
jgi:hypothetical protein